MTADRNIDEHRTTGYNTGFASGWATCLVNIDERALCFYSSSVQVECFVLRNARQLLASTVNDHYSFWKPKFNKP